MAGRPARGTKRAQGAIDTLRSGALRVRVYAGIDPVSKQRHYLTEIIEPGPKADRDAEATRARLVGDVRERRNPRTNATVDELLTRYLDQFDGSPNTLTLYRGYVRNHISPLLGHEKVGDLDADILDSFYAALRRCRLHCSGRTGIDHRTMAKHECDDRCRPHQCRPLDASTVRHMHFILSGAYRKAVRWRWVSVSPMGQAEPPPAPKPNPQPPAPRDAARIVNEAWRDPDWGALIWTTMTTGARRGELAALREDDLDLTEGRESLWLRRAIRKDENGRLVEAELKTHQQRRVALDLETAVVLRDHLGRWSARLELLGKRLTGRLYLFSGAPDGSTWPRPEGISQRYDRLAKRLDVGTTFHKLRHYTATELIVAGVDVRTVAGRLGHAGGGSTTLRTYTAWVSEADQRAATGLGSGMPARPAEVDETERQQTNPRQPYERVAAALRQRILSGEIAEGGPLPPEKEVCAEHGVSVSTARRATALLRSWGLLGPTGRRVTAPRAAPATPTNRVVAILNVPEVATPTTLWSVTLRGPGGRYPPRVVSGSVADPGAFRPHLVGIARMEAPGIADDGEEWIGRFELEIAEVGSDHPTLTLRW
ncbi:MAG: tyrosine-type recombinase/integrase [Pseudonocardiales bacterium]|nr:tyrosine-type recombinase/integrase [Pseudonocardiales bacterium]